MQLFISAAPGHVEEFEIANNVTLYQLAEAVCRAHELVPSASRTMLILSVDELSRLTRDNAYLRRGNPVETLEASFGVEVRLSDAHATLTELAYAMGLQYTPETIPMLAAANVAAMIREMAST